MKVGRGLGAMLSRTTSHQCCGWWCRIRTTEESVGFLLDLLIGGMFCVSMSGFGEEIRRINVGR